MILYFDWLYLFLLYYNHSTTISRGVIRYPNGLMKKKSWPDNFPWPQQKLTDLYYLDIIIYVMD